MTTEKKITMTTKEKIALINKAIDHLLDLSISWVLSDDELLYLYHVFWCIRQYYRIMDVKVFKED